MDTALNVSVNSLDYVPNSDRKLQLDHFAFLIEKVADRDIEAFNEIYSNFSQIVFNLMVRTLQNREEAEDALQDVFIQIWDKAYTYDSSKGAVSTWITNMARNRAIDKLRSRSSRKHINLIDDESIKSNDDINNIVEEINERRVVINSALESIPAEQRKVIEMAYFDGLTHIEISELLSLPVGTVKTRIALGISKLRKRIIPHISYRTEEVQIQ